MPNFANDPSRNSWLEVKKNSDFPIQNIPFGVFITKEDVITIGTRIGDERVKSSACEVLVVQLLIPTTPDVDHACSC